VNANTKVYPVILLHGWPGSVREFYEMIPLLTNPSKDNIAFEIIIPSLAGYGWSEGASKQGLSAGKMSVVMRNLMLRVGFKKFYVQGGDWGSIIGSYIAAFFPENVLGYHSNMCTAMTTYGAIKQAIAGLWPSYFIEEEKYIEWAYPSGPKNLQLLQESGYMHIQATKPDTVGIALQGNAVGIAAYIIEKFSSWTNMNYRNLNDGGLEKYFTLDSLLDNIMIYYLSDSITTSMRLYKETFGDSGLWDQNRVLVTPKTGCAHFKHEIAHQFHFTLKDRFTDIVQHSFYEDGGHFAALQFPKILYEDFVQFVKKTL